MVMTENTRPVPCVLPGVTLFVNTPSVSLITILSLQSSSPLLQENTSSLS